MIRKKISLALIIFVLISLAIFATRCLTVKRFFMWIKQGWDNLLCCFGERRALYNETLMQLHERGLPSATETSQHPASRTYQRPAYPEAVSNHDMPAGFL